MKSILTIFLCLLVLSTISTEAQNSHPLIVNEHWTKKPYRPFRIVDDNEYDYIFEDDRFTVTSICHGEFGGSVTFANKDTGKKHITRATCAVMVNELNDKYYLTNSLAHMVGSTEIVELTITDTLTRKQIASATELLTLASFVYQGRLYHVTTYFDSTYIAIASNGTFKPVIKLSDVYYAPYGDVRIEDNGHVIVKFKSKQAKGYIDIYENQINVYRRK